MWNFLTITISVSDGQIYDYKQLTSNTKIGDPTKTDRYCDVCQGYLPFSSLVWWYVILIVIIEILKILKLYIPLSESPHFPDVSVPQLFDYLSNTPSNTSLVPDGVPTNVKKWAPDRTALKVFEVSGVQF